MAIHKQCDVRKVRLVGPDACDGPMTVRHEGWVVTVEVTRTPPDLEQPCMSVTALKRIIEHGELEPVDSDDDDSIRLPVERRG